MRYANILSPPNQIVMSRAVWPEFEQNLLSQQFPSMAESRTTSLQLRFGGDHCDQGLEEEQAGQLAWALTILT